VEAEAVARSRQAVAVADLVLFVEDRSQEREPVRRASVQIGKVLCVANKSDLPAAWSDEGAVSVSARTGAGPRPRREKTVAALDADLQRDRPALTNVRHIALVERAQDALVRARAAASTAGGSMPEEFVLADLADARAALEEVSGRRTTEDLLT